MEAVPQQQGHEAAALRSSTAAHAHQMNKPPATARPWPRGGASSSAASPPPLPPPKVYRVEPREFRDLVQRLTGAPPTTTAALHQRRHPQQQQYQQHRAPAVVQPQPVRAEQQQAYHAPAAAPWFSFPMAAGAVEAAQQQHTQHGTFF